MTHALAGHDYILAFAYCTGVLVWFGLVWFDFIQDIWFYKIPPYVV